MSIIDAKLTSSNFTKSTFIFGLVCLAMAFILSFNIGKEYTRQLPVSGGLIGPITVDDSNSVYSIEVSQYMSDNSWSAINVNVLDKNQQYLFSFGDELWHASGYDSEGAWTESVNNFSLKITFPEKGEYYLQLEGEKSENNTIDQVSVVVTEKLGSSLAFAWVGILSLIIAVIVWFRSASKK